MKMGTIYKSTLRPLRRRNRPAAPRGYGKFHPTSDWLHVETELPIRCPECLHRLNVSQEEFSRQVVCVATGR